MKWGADASSVSELANKRTNEQATGGAEEEKEENRPKTKWNETKQNSIRARIKIV